MEEMVAAALVGAGVGYAVRFGQEQIQRAGRALAGNDLVEATTRLGREALVGGAQVAQAGARSTADVAQAGARGAVDVAQAGARGAVDAARAGARGGALIAAVAAGRIASTGRQRAGGAPPARAVRVPVGEGRPAARRGTTRRGGQPSARTRAGAEPTSRTTTRGRGGTRTGTRAGGRRGGARATT
jgi:hypothetical protein